MMVGVVSGGIPIFHVSVISFMASLNDAPSEKVYGVSCQISFWPAPVRRLEHKTLIFHDLPVSIPALVKSEAPPPEKRGQFDHSGRTDLFARPRELACCDITGQVRQRYVFQVRILILNVDLELIFL